MELAKKIVQLIISVIILLSITICITDISIGIPFIDSISFMQSNSFVWIILLLFVYSMIRRILEVKEKRLIICAGVLATILATLSVIGDAINAYLDLSIVITNKNLILYYLIKWLGNVALLYTGTILVFSFLDKKVDANVKRKVRKIFEPQKRNLFIYWIIIFVAYIPYLLTYFPGIITPDSLSQISQAAGIQELSNHHPILHTFVISIFVKIGGILGNYNIGIAIYSIVQMLALSGIFAYTIYYMSKKEIPLMFRVITFIFYAFYPVHSMYSVTMWKDIPFAICMLWFVIMLNELITNKDKFLQSKKNLILFAITILLVILFRNNGIYVIFLTVPFIFVFAKQYYKQLIVVFVGVILVYSVIWKGLIFNLLNIQEGSSVEALSVPLQQIARVMRDKEEVLTEEEREIINKFWPDVKLGEIYDPRLSDNVKWSIDSKEFDENKMELLTLWFKMFFKYPGIYVESFLCNSYGYWYPEASNWVVSRVIADAQTQEQKDLDIKQEPIIEGDIVKIIDSYTEKRNIPILSMLFSIGFAMWLVFTQITYIIYKKQYKLLLIFAPILFLWLTNLASPVFCEFRYMYSLFTCLPICLFVCMQKNEEKGNN